MADSVAVQRSFYEVDVFTTTPYSGNALAVVLDGQGLTGHEMQRFARWMNLSETTFVFSPSRAGADYQVRIFTPTVELPFAGHPTLGTCHAWLSSGAAPADPGVIVQECAAGLIPIRSMDDRLAFAAPPLVRSGPVDDRQLTRIAAMLRIAGHVAEFAHAGHSIRASSPRNRSDDEKRLRP